MRNVVIKKQNGEFTTFTSSLTTYQLDQNRPFGIAYRTQCSCTLSESELNEWWNYVDALLLENPIEDFYTIWRIEDGGQLYGFEN